MVSQLGQDSTSSGTGRARPWRGGRRGPKQTSKRLCRLDAAPVGRRAHRNTYRDFTPPRIEVRDRRLHDRPVLATRVTTSLSSSSSCSLIPPVLPEAMAASRASFEG